MRDFLLTALEFANSFIREDWRAFGGIIITAIRSSDWAKDDVRWNETAAVVQGWLIDVMTAKDETDAELSRQLRIAAELAATRELKRLNLLRGA